MKTAFVLKQLTALLLAIGSAGTVAWAQEAEPLLPAPDPVPAKVPPAASAPLPASTPTPPPAPAAVVEQTPTPREPVAQPPTSAADPPAPTVPATPQALPKGVPAAAADVPKPQAEPAIVGTEVAPLVETVIDAPANEQDLWDRVRRLYVIPDMDNELVRKWEQFYTTRPDYLQRMFERGGRYLFHIVEETDKRGMPSELALLPFIESAFNPHALSSARASGIWQFMPATGKHFELRQNLFRDDRRSVLDSTRAALDYLQQLHKLFGDWQLALAAYNWGQGNVGRAIANNRRVGRGVEYADLMMPDETRNYVPKLQAIANIVGRPEQFGVQLPPLKNHPYFLTVNVDRDIDVSVAARLAGLPIEEFQALNPQMNKPVILAAGTPQLLLPFDGALRFKSEVPRHRGPFATWTAWVAPRTLKPSEAAQSVGMSEQLLREVNRIPPRMLVKAGSTLLVPRSPSSLRDVSEHVADTASIILAPEAIPGRKRMVKAGPKGETVAALARRYRVAPAQVARWNGVPATASFKGGQSVVLFSTPAQPAARNLARGKAAPAVAKGDRAAPRVAAKGPSKGRSASRAPVRVAKR